MEAEVLVGVGVGGSGGRKSKLAFGNKPQQIVRRWVAVATRTRVCFDGS